MGLAKYYPELSEKDMAFLCGVSTPAIRKYIYEHSVDPDFDKALIKYRNIREYLLDENHRDETYEQIGKALNDKYGGGYSTGTVYALLNEVSLKLYRMVQDCLKDNSEATDDQIADIIKPKPKPKSEGDPEKIHAKYLRLAKRLRITPPNRPAKGKISVVDLSFSPQMLPRVSDDEGDILRLIRKVWLKRVPQFECDLTFGKGNFYRKGERGPEKWRFDKYPDVDSDVLPLDKASSMIPDDSLMSVVIDLPQAIREDGIGDSAAFSSEEDMVLSYYHLIKIAYDKLKQSFDRGQGGILVVKTGDFDYKDERLWVHHFVIDLATGRKAGLTERFFAILKRNGITPEFDMALVDKAILTFSPEEPNTPTGRSKQAHNYFLIFQRTEVEKELVYIRAEDRHIIIGDRYLPKNVRGKYRDKLISGTLKLDRPPLSLGSEKESRNYAREIIRKASREDIIEVCKALSDDQIRRIKEYEGFPFEIYPPLENSLTGIEIIDLLYRNYSRHYNKKKDIRRDGTPAAEREARFDKVSRHVSDALYRCGFVYVDFGEEGRLYLEGLEDEEA